MHAPRKIFLLGTAVYALFSYGGIRSPDCEVTFRTAEALAFQGTPGVSRPLERWPTFDGFREGHDGRLYSVFGPAESYALSLFLPLAEAINRTGWYEAIPERIPVSHYAGQGIRTILEGRRPADMRPHALRLLMAPFNVVVSALVATIFFLLAQTLTGRETGAWYATIAFAFASLAFPYSGTFFNEPLTILFVMLSLLLLVRNDCGMEPWGRRRRTSLLGAGFFLGLAVATHVTAMLFAPFLFLYALAPDLKPRFRLSRRLAAGGACFASGMCVIGVLFAYYNYVRFGSILESGRTLSFAHYGAEMIVWPWHGLNYLLVSGGKGLVWYCPVILAGLLAWRTFHRRHAFLAKILVAAIVFRVLFFASVFWRCGFCLGPRYLLPVIPLLLLPIAFSVEELVEKRRYAHLNALLVMLVLCTAQQLFFALGEPFSFLHFIRESFQKQDFNIFYNDEIFMSWSFSPAIYLLEGLRGPFLLRGIPLGNYALWALCAILATVPLCVWHARNLKMWQSRPGSRIN